MKSKIEMMHNGVQQGDGCEETRRRNRETVDTGETNSSSGSKQLDPQHKKESANSEKESRLMIECKANEDIHRINMKFNHTMKEEKKLYVRKYRSVQMIRDSDTTELSNMAIV